MAGYDPTTVLLPTYSHVLYAPVGTAPPGSPYAIDVNAAVPFVGWSLLGYTADDNNVKLTRSGGDAKTYGANQDPSLRNANDPTTFGLEIPALSMVNDVLTYFFGGGDATGVNTFIIPKATSNQEIAVYFIFVDGTDRAGLYVPRVAISGSGDLEFDPSKITEMTLVASVLSYSGFSGLASFFKANLGVAGPVPKFFSPAGTIPAAGGKVLTFTGSNLSGVTVVNFGGTPGTALTATATTVTVTAPAKTAGTYPTAFVASSGTVAGPQVTYV